MGILDEDVAKVRSSVDIVQVISPHVQLKRVGRRWTGICPFHAEKSPSFSVNAEMGMYYCFGCGAKGDAITFVREVEHLDFVAAVEKLAGMASVELRYSDNNNSEFRKWRAELTAAVGAAVEFYHTQLLESPDAGAARAYLRSRGFTGDEVRHYQIGWAPDTGFALNNHLRLPKKVMVESGLGIASDSGKVRDFFRGRLMFPIFSPTGDAVAFGGRILPGADGPKYKNSSSGTIYDKSRVLYGLNWAKNEIVQRDEAILCEGYTDVIGFHAVGLGRAVATCGTALTEEHVKLLVNYSRRLVLAFDADAAGQNAAARLLEWERKYGLDLVVAQMPPGSDPGELSRNDPEALHRAVEGAVPFLKFRVDRVVADHDLGAVEGRVRAADAARIVIDEHPDPLIRDQYIMDLADRLDLNADDLRKRKPNPAAATPTRRFTKAPEPEARPLVNASSLGLNEDSPELEALRVILDNPTGNAPLFHESVFMNRACRETFVLLRSVDWQPDRLPADTDAVTADLVNRLVVQDHTVDPVEVLERLVFVAGTQHLQQLTKQARTATGDDILRVAEDVRWLKNQLELMRDRVTAIDSLPDVLEWLIENYTPPAEMEAPVGRVDAPHPTEEAEETQGETPSSSTEPAGPAGDDDGYLSHLDAQYENEGEIYYEHEPTE